jgi:hypothetical protein
VSNAIPQWSSGLDPESERTLAACPEVPAWTENLLFTPYDPIADIGMWLHLGTVADRWEMWEDRVLIALPEDQGVLSMWAYHRTARRCESRIPLRAAVSEMAHHLRRLLCAVFVRGDA